MFISRKNDIKEFPFQEARNLQGTDLEEWAESVNLKVYNSWMLPQLQAYFGSWDVTLDEESQLYDPKALAKDNINSDWAIGIWKVCTKLKRSALVKSQSQAPYMEYSALVPLILAGLKKFKGIKYTSWKTEGLEYIVETELFKAMTTKMEPISNERLLELRNQGLLTKTGKNAGALKSPTSAWKLTGLQGTEFTGKPVLVSTIMTQIWVAHPSLRSPYMILDIDDWDNMPDPLISTQVIAPTKMAEQELQDLPWLV